MLSLANMVQGTPCPRASIGPLSSVRGHDSMFHAPSPRQPGLLRSQAPGLEYHGLPCHQVQTAMRLTASSPIVRGLQAWRCRPLPWAAAVQQNSVGGHVMIRTSHPN